MTQLGKPALPGYSPWFDLYYGLQRDPRPVRFAVKP